MYILGIDLGTTKIAGVLLEVPGNRVVKVISRDSGADLASGHDWEKIQDPELIVGTALSIIGELKRGAGEKVACIGISSQMHGFVYLNGAGKSVSPLYTWQDSRAALPVDPSGKTVRDIIKDKTGKSIFSGYALATHFYNCRNDLQPAEACQIASIGCYLGMGLCGLQEASVDPSEGASFGLYDQDNIETIHPIKPHSFTYTFY